MCILFSFSECMVSTGSKYMVLWEDEHLKIFSYFIQFLYFKLQKCYVEVTGKFWVDILLKNMLNSWFQNIHSFPNELLELHALHIHLKYWKE